MNLRTSSFAARGRARGFTLVELMIAMLLGLIALGAVLSLIALNSRNYRTGEAIGQIQDGMRTAFDLISRDVREARGTGCGSLNQSLSAPGFKLQPPVWWDDSNTPPGLRLYGEGAAMGTAAPSNRAAKGAAILVQGVTGASYTITAEATDRVTFTAPGSNNDFRKDDVVVLCDGRPRDPLRSGLVAELAQIDQVSGNNITLKLLENGTGTEGDFNPNFTDQSGQARILFPTVTRYAATIWYVGNNEPGRRTATSLYRVRSNGIAGATQRDEIIEGVTDFKIQYRTGNDEITELDPGNSVKDSAAKPINTVVVTLFFESADTRVGDTADSGDQRLERDYSAIIAIRNP